MVTGTTANQGDDIAGIVDKVGANVTEFKLGDRVAAFHEIGKPGGSYAEYAIAWQHTTFHIPKSTSFEEASTIPLASMTAALGLYLTLGLPQPWTPAKEPTPVVLYGAASAVGSYAIQLAKQSNIHPLICVAGRSIAHVEKLIDRNKGDVVVDYREGDDAVVENIKKVLGHTKLLHALDSVSEKGSYRNLGKVVAPGGTITTLLPVMEQDAIPDVVAAPLTFVGSVHRDAQDFGHVYYRYITKGLRDGWFKPQPHVVVAGGLEGIQEGMDKLAAGRATALKFVFRILETNGVDKDLDLI